MAAFSALSNVRRAYGDSWRRHRVFILLYLLLRLLVLAVLAPLLGGLINLAVSLSSQSALTDQDIVGFFLTPTGFVVTIGVISLFLVVEVLGFAAMTAIWRAGGDDRLAAVQAALWAVLRRFRPLVGFAVLFVLRVLVLASPFVLAGLFVAQRFLSTYDINYYLTHRPPQAMMAAAVIAVLLLGLAVTLLIRLSGWALALHMVVFDGVSASAAFVRSAEQMKGRRLGLQVELVLWFVVRMLLIGATGVLAGAVLNLIPLNAGSGLQMLLSLTLIVVALWRLAGAAVSAIALAALAKLVEGHSQSGAALQPPRAGAAEGRPGRLVLVVAALVALAAFGVWSGGQLLDGIRTHDDVTIIAHRGAAGARPENTLASVRKAIEDGTDWVEIDVQETADGEVVVIHDSDFMKLSGVPLKIWDATMDDLADIDIGGWYDAAYVDQRTPLLRDVLKMAKGRAKVLIELKYYGHDVELEPRVIRIVEALQMEDQIATMSLKYPAVKKMLSLRPDWRTGVLAATSVGNLAGLDGEFVAVSMAQAGPRLVQRIKAAGKDLYVWTVNDPLDMSKMISMGVDGLITDEPALARQVLRARADLSTPERLVLWMTEELGLSMNDKGYRDASP
ncbi:glycerophosphoryl diester phosphodiesterase membrane domain-containing protein [Rhodobacteraceae bacterium F11138]|nr:glycerophosphoryl diester phosphodiesterase membrane domain-containing protein [Rhodobacteraceae bacterium F11138]